MKTWTWTCDECGASGGPYFSAEAARDAMAAHDCPVGPVKP